MGINSDLFQIVVTIAGILSGWFIKVIHEELKAQREANRLLADKLAEIEVLVVGEYVKRDDYMRDIEAFFKKLDKIEDLLRGKADKQ